MFLLCNHFHKQCTELLRKSNCLPKIELSSFVLGNNRPNCNLDYIFNTNDFLEIIYFEYLFDHFAFFFFQATSGGRASYYVSYKREAFAQIKLPKYSLPKVLLHLCSPLLLSLYMIVALVI